MSTAKVDANFAFVMTLEIVQNFLVLTDKLCFFEKFQHPEYHLSSEQRSKRENIYKNLHLPECTFNSG
jgi:hypothetical protein